MRLTWYLKLDETFQISNLLFVSTMELPFSCLAYARHFPWTKPDRTAHQERVGPVRRQLGKKPATKTINWDMNYSNLQRKGAHEILCRLGLQRWQDLVLFGPGQGLRWCRGSWLRTSLPGNGNCLQSHTQHQLSSEASSMSHLHEDKPKTNIGPCQILVLDIFQEYQKE